MVHPDDVSRFSELNVYADLHAQFAFGEPDMAEQLGTERYEQRFFPAQSLLESGAVLTIGADAPAGDENPFMSIAVITSRQIPGVTEVLPPESEALTVEQAIRAYTLDAARMLGMEEKVGSIEVGKRADLVIIDRSPFGATTEQIAGTSVLTTMMNGQVVYEAPSS
jgi:predicted amidohydrolase YtcJ